MTGEVLELALRVDDRDRRVVERFFNDPAQRSALSRTRAALDEQAPGKKSIEIKVECAARMVAQRYAIVCGLGERPDGGDAGDSGILVLASYGLGCQVRAATCLVIGAVLATRSAESVSKVSGMTRAS